MTTSNQTNPKVDAYINRTKSWQEETIKLREIVLRLQLSEELKWGKPCYTYQDSNIIIIQGFKDYIALLFTQGALLKDPHGMLIQQTEHVQAARQLRFTSLQQIIEMESVIRDYIQEAMAAEKDGLKVEMKKNTDLNIPEELQAKFDESPDLKKAFEALTPGRQRAYVLHFSAPKQSKTRVSRIEKCIPDILVGKGLND